MPRSLGSLIGRVRTRPFLVVKEALSTGAHAVNIEHDSHRTWQDKCILVVVIWNIHFELQTI